MHKDVFRSGMAILRISDEEVEDITKIVKTLEDSGLLTKDNTHKTERKTK